MGRKRHLSNAPITEAIMDVQFMAAEVGLDDLERALEPYWNDGWIRHQSHTFSARISPAAGEVTGASAQLSGYLAVSPDEQDVISLKLDRLTATRVRRYERWEDLWQLLAKGFHSYVEATKPSAVRRIGVRFVNRLNLVDSLGSFDRVLERPPLMVLKEGLERARITNFLRRHVVEDLPGGFTANFTVGTVTPEPGEEATAIGPLILDIDVFKVCKLPVDQETLLAEFDQMRSIKNELFFGSLTDECLERYS